MTKADIAAETFARGGAGEETFARSRAGERSTLTQEKTSLSQTITRVDLAEAVYRTVGLSRKESAQLVEMVIGEMVDCLALGETVKLSSFGSFIVRDKGERVGRNPKTGVEVPIMQRRVLVFKPSNVLKAQMNGEAVPEEDL